MSQLTLFEAAVALLALLVLIAIAWAVWDVLRGEKLRVRVEANRKTAAAAQGAADQALRLVGQLADSLTGGTPAEEDDGRVVTREFELGGQPRRFHFRDTTDDGSETS